MRKRIFQAGAALLGFGCLAVLLTVRTGPAVDETAAEQHDTTAAEVRLSDNALAIHEQVREEVAARLAAEPPDDRGSRGDERPEWLQSVVDRGVIDDRYAELLLRDDYLDVVQERFHVLKHDSNARERDGCDRHEVANGKPLCWNEWGYDPYLGYDLDTLRGMAAVDASAAEALSLRAMDRETRLYYAVRASQLSGRPGPIARFISGSTSSLSGDEKHQELLQSYMLALMVDDMGYPYRHSAEMAYWLEMNDVPEEDINQALMAGLVLTEPTGEDR